MADQLPSNAVFRLPENVDTLARMRDQLSDYLGTLERNTDSVNAWLDEKRTDVIVGHHQLMRAIVQDKDEQKAQKAVKDMGDIAGFVLSMQDFGALAEKSFGKNSTFAKTIAGITPGIPPKILEDLPELRAPTDEEMNAPEIKPVTPSEEDLEAARRKWWNPGSWFGKTEEELMAEAAAESERKINEIKRHWGLVKTELVSLQSERHYYIDSFMDWIADTMEPEDFTKSEADVARTMQTYQNPQYVIDLAHEDYGLVIHGKALALREQALDYSKVAALIDEQKITDFIKVLPGLFPQTETTETQMAKKLLLKDFAVASFAELALEKVADRKDQLALLEAALKLEPSFKLTKETTPAQVFQRIVTETLDAKNPLDSRALAVTLDKLKTAKGYNEDQLADMTGFTAAGKTVFEKLAARFDTRMDQLKKAVDDLVTGMNARLSGAKGSTPPAANSHGTALTQFVTAVRTQDANAMNSLLGTLGSGPKALSSRGFQALLDLTYPNTSIVAELKKTATDTATLATLMDTALNAGMLDEFRINSGAAHANTAAFKNFFQQDVLGDQSAFPLQTARKLMAATYANGGLDGLRSELTRTGGWLEKTVANEALSPAQKNDWTAALLEPFTSDIVKSNILFEAAQNAKDAQAAKTLAQMEATFSGPDVRLDDGKLMTNLGRIANIWYNADAQVMHYTANGTGHIFMENVSPVMAKDVLSHIQRKGGFLSEYDGLFRPENIDRITSDAQGSKVTWYRHSGNLNVVGADLDALHAREDFMHHTEANGRIQSINQKSIALLQPLEDGSWLLVDRYGAVQFLEGKIALTPQAPLIDLGGTYFNPQNASIISLDAEKNRLDFRLESRDFDDLLERAAPGEYFYSVELPSKGVFDDVEKAVRAADGVTAPDDKSLSSMFFNLKKLGYMMFADDGDAGFSCHKFGPAKKPGFINTEEDMAQGIFNGLARQDGVIAVAGLMAHKDNIDDAYYNVDKGRFYMVVGSDLLQVDCTDDEAYAALKKLAKEDGFSVVGANYVQDKKGGTTELPADIINLNNATLIFSAPEQERTFVICDSEKFHISLDEKQAAALMDGIVRDGLKDTRAALPNNAQWTQDLDKAQAALPFLAVPVTSSLTQVSKNILLDVALERTSGRSVLPKAQADFSIAATAPVKLETEKTMTYPPRKPRAPKFG